MFTGKTQDNSSLIKNNNYNGLQHNFKNSFQEYSPWCPQENRCNDGPVMPRSQESEKSSQDHNHASNQLTKLGALNMCALTQPEDLILWAK